MRRGLLALLPVLLLAACGGGEPPGGVLGTTARQCTPGYRPLGSAKLAWAAVVRDQAVAYRRPGGRVLAAFGSHNENRYPTVLGVLGRRVRRDCTASWYRVQLPVRPNGIVGWVRASAVETATVKSRIVVDVSARRVTLLRAGRRVLSAPVAVGAPATPTPTGRYYVNQRLVPDDPAGPFGPGAIGVSAFSNVLTGWAQGGPIAIHGTNAPWSIGHAVSNGCIRVENRILRRLFDETPAGTPVIIEP